jgi:MFS family permease
MRILSGVDMGLAILITSYLYVKFIKEPFSKKQRLWVAAAYFIFAVLMTGIVLYSGVFNDLLAPEEQLEPEGVRTVFLITTGIILFFAVINYFLLGWASKWIHKQMELKNEQHNTRKTQ